MGSPGQHTTKLVLVRQVQPLEPTPNTTNHDHYIAKRPQWQHTPQLNVRQQIPTNNRLPANKQVNPTVHAFIIPLPQYPNTDNHQYTNHHTHLPTSNLHAAPYSTNASTTSTINGSKAIPPSPTSPIPNVRLSNHDQEHPRTERNVCLR